MELNERVAKVETRIDNVEERMDKQDRLIESIHEIASSQKNMEKTLNTVSNKVESIGNKVVELEYNPNKEKAKKWDEVTWKIALLIITGAAMYLLGMVFPFIK